MSLTQARMKAALDAGLTGVTHIQWSSDGINESGSLARTALTGEPKLTAATTANPSVMSNENAETSAAAGAGVTISHFAYSGGEEGADRFTEWVALDDDAVLLGGGKITVAAAALKVQLHQSAVAP
jgi:hypothetical protein